VHAIEILFPENQWPISEKMCLGCDLSVSVPSSGCSFYIHGVKFDKTLIVSVQQALRMRSNALWEKASIIKSKAGNC
jgi:hypothetical protein